MSGYNVQNLAAATAPAPPQFERAIWYQYYLHGERGHAGIAAFRREFTRLLWHEWSPHWQFTDDEFNATATSFDNPDFVDVVVHSYRHRYELAQGDPAYQQLEDAISAQPPIPVPTVVLDPTDDPLIPFVAPREAHEWRFPQLLDARPVNAGHNVPQEAPTPFADAVLHARASTETDIRKAARS